MILLNFAIGKISSKGQIVIPSSMRTNFNSGDELLFIKKDDKIVLKKMGGVMKNLKDDIEFANNIEKIWQEYDDGNFISTNSDNFLEELDKC